MSNGKTPVKSCNSRVFLCPESDKKSDFFTSANPTSSTSYKKGHGMGPFRDLKLFFDL